MPAAKQYVVSEKKYMENITWANETEMSISKNNRYVIMWEYCCMLLFVYDKAVGYLTWNKFTFTSFQQYGLFHICQHGLLDRWYLVRLFHSGFLDRDVACLTTPSSIRSSLDFQVSYTQKDIPPFQTTCSCPL